MKKLLLSVLAACVSWSALAQEKVDTTSADKLGWQLAIHSYTFQKFPIFEAIDMASALGVKYMSVSGSVMMENSNRLTTVNLTDAQR